MVDLKQLASGLHLRTVLDESAGEDPRAERPWLWQIPAKFGHVFVQGVDTLGVYCRSNRLRDRLVAAGVTIRQDGDREWSGTFSTDRLSDVAQILQCRKRKVVSPEERERLAALSAVHGFARREIHQPEDPCADLAGLEDEDDGIDVED